MEIEVIADGYNIVVDNGKTQNSYQIPVADSEKHSNTVGFLSTHYNHNCARLGEFELKNINIYTKEVAPDT